jgi:phage repressor protein C with HTH and peptisase S24 domain
MEKEVKKHYLNDLLSYLQLNETEFVNSLKGVSQSKINNVLNFRNGISADLARKIIAKYKDVSFEWLRTGEGEMLIAEKPICISLEKKVQKRNLIPFYDDVCTIGGNNEYIANMASSQHVEYIDTGDWFNNATAAIRHYGDSMLEYPSGCILALKQVQDFRLIIPGKDYVIETEEYRLTKKVRLIKEGIRAYSSNEEKYDDGELIHQPFDVPFELIHKIFEVLGYVVKKGSGTLVYSNQNK